MGELSLAASRIKPVKQGSVGGDVSTAIAGLLDGIRKRQLENQDKKRRDTLLKFEGDRVAQGQRQIDLQGQQLELGRSQFAESQRQHREAERIAAEKRIEEQAGKTARITEIEDYASKLKLPIVRSQLESMSLQNLGDMADDLRMRVEGDLNRQSQEKQQRIQSGIQSQQIELMKRQEVIQEILRLENALNASRNFGSQAQKSLDEDRMTVLQLRTAARDLAKAKGIDENTAYQQLYQQELQNRRAGLGDTQDIPTLQRELQLRRDELAKMRGAPVQGAGQSPTTANNPLYWDSLSPEGRLKLEADTKAALQRGQVLDLDAMRADGVPVDAWRADLNSAMAPPMSQGPNAAMGMLSGAQQQIDARAAATPQPPAPAAAPGGAAGFGAMGAIPSTANIFDPVMQAFTSNTRLRRKGFGAPVTSAPSVLNLPPGGVRNPIK